MAKLSYNASKLLDLQVEKNRLESEMGTILETVPEGENRARFMRGTSYRIFVSEIAAIERKMVAVQDKIDNAAKVKDIETTLEQLAKLPLMRLQLGQYREQLAKLQESIAEKESEIVELESSRAKLIELDEQSA